MLSTAARRLGMSRPPYAEEKWSRTRHGEK
jgi:hypothetical protein